MHNFLCIHANFRLKLFTRRWEIIFWKFLHVGKWKSFYINKMTWKASNSGLSWLCLVCYISDQRCLFCWKSSETSAVYARNYHNVCFELHSFLSHFLDSILPNIVILCFPIFAVKLECSLHVEKMHQLKMTYLIRKKRKNLVGLAKNTAQELNTF